jgi:hypothetical protein
MTKPVLEVLVDITWLAMWLGPVPSLLMWRSRWVGFRLGYLFAILWFWLFWSLHLHLGYELDLESYRLYPQGGKPLNEWGLFVMLAGGFLGSIYCGCLAIAWVIVVLLIRGVRRLWRLRSDRIEHR